MKRELMIPPARWRSHAPERQPAGRASDSVPDVLRLRVESVLTDRSSGMVFSVFAVFFTTVAGASTRCWG